MKLDYRIKILAVLVGLSSFVGCISKSDRMLRNIKLPDGAEVRYLEKPGYFGADGYDVTLGKFTLGKKSWDYRGTISGLPGKSSTDIHFRIHKDQTEYFLTDKTSLYLSLETDDGDEFSSSPRYDELVARTGTGDYLLITSRLWAQAITSMQHKEMAIIVRYRFEGDGVDASPPAEAELHIRSGGFK